MWTGKCSIDASGQPRCSRSHLRFVLWIRQLAPIRMTLIELRDHFLDMLNAQQKLRKTYAGLSWITAEIELMHRLVNTERAARGIAGVPVSDIHRIESGCCGHSDYSLKFSLRCAELVLKEEA